jgi:glycerophosphoryl diester phosphodiesterase
MAGSVNPFLARGAGPLIVGHRGVPLLHQENTLAGFRRAVALAVPAVELDVRLTADGRAVCVHDEDLERLTGDGGRVSELTWDQLHRRRVRRELPMGVDAAGAPVVVRYARAEPIALLAEVLAEIGDRAAVNVELKLTPHRWWDTAVSAVVAAEVLAAGARQRVIVTSFDPGKLRAVARSPAALAVGFAFDDSMLDFAAPVLDRLPLPLTEVCARDPRPHRNGRRLLRGLVDTGVVPRLLAARAVGVEHTLVGPRTAARLHGRGIACGTHTLFPIGSTTGKPIHASAAAAAEVHRLAAAGVDWIESDDPERVLALLAA